MSHDASLPEHIGDVAMFAACSRRERQTIARLVTERNVPAGKELTREGEPGHEFVIVIEGIAVATRHGREVATFGPGDHFGEIALLDPGDRTATVTAATPMRVAVVTPREFAQMLDEVPALAHSVMRGLARQIRELTKDAAV